MKHELQLIKKKAVLATNCTRNEEAIMCLLDIIKLTESCIGGIDYIDDKLADISMSMKRVTR